MSQRTEQVAELVREAAALFLNRESNHLSLITVTRAEISPDLKNTTVFISVYPEEKEVEALHFTRRKRSLFKEYLKSHTKLRRIPFVEFEIDHGEKNRQRLDDISRNL
ncbi:hypothetical protein A3D62_02120 [Candidatus Kaiserbacteria bacterium RIFCSPHIGHO2_02_FULL_49_11]|uniref:Ribosome-binding factor A n=1 Tax=Candidatus Kaiserbacteria bacterium RIFCSPHIGHO2_02_FULL_49_11 TaxID=1798489 RepID=A0A1F6D059_9BACT|nr:MAG: hypothetical protein A3D62_02120 [Candidatus Kaiserbacteria bacterium RIFCSPHIGHO2_02_FULL_49_11]